MAENNSGINNSQGDNKYGGHNNYDEHSHCYVKGTLIATDKGQVAVEALREGDLVRTLSNEMVPIKWLGHRRVDCKRSSKPELAHPVKIKKDAFAPNMPTRDFYLSPLHSVYVEGVFVPVIDLVNGVSIIQEEFSHVTYYHVELPTHNVIYAEGMPAETYLDDNNRSFFTNQSTSQAIELNPEMPKLASKEIWESKGFAKVMRKGQDPIVDHISASLLERATQMMDQLAEQAA